MAIPFLSIPTPSPHNLSSSSNPAHLFLTSKFSHLSIAKPPQTTTIRMGGGPRTFPGGVSKWQWKRMQAKKAKQLLRARLARERQIYEMRKRAELSAAVSDLERPWEVVEKAPKLFSARADEQLKVLADRFQKPGGFDLWSEKDGPQLFEAVDGLPSARFFPKGVVHSIRPYGKITNGDGNSDEDSDMDPGIVKRNGNDEKLKKNGYTRRIGNVDTGRGYSFSDEDSCQTNGYENSRNANGESGKNENRRIRCEDSGLGHKNGHENTRNVNEKSREKGNRRIGTRNEKRNTKGANGREVRTTLNSKVFDMSLQDDGSYG